MLEDQQNAATIVVEFSDGTRLDTCYPIGPSKFHDYFELPPEHNLEPTTEALNPIPAVPNVAATRSDVAKELEVKSATELDDSEVRQALNGVGRDHWVTILDMSVGAAGGNQWPSITLYMPETVLAIQSQSAKRQFTKYEPSEEERRRSLMVVAEGWAGKTITDGCTSITRVILLSERSGGIVVEAYSSQPLSETWLNNFGATNRCQALQAKFSLDDVHRVKTAAANGEFFIAVFSGSLNTKIYKVKRKFQAKLNLD
jgi:hypothetical protein